MKGPFQVGVDSSRRRSHWTGLHSYRPDVGGIRRRPASAVPGPTPPRPSAPGPRCGVLHRVSGYAGGGPRLPAEGIWAAAATGYAHFLVAATPWARKMGIQQQRISPRHRSAPRRLRKNPRRGKYHRLSGCCLYSSYAGSECGRQTVSATIQAFGPALRWPLTWRVLRRSPRNWGARQPGAPGRPLALTGSLPIAPEIMTFRKQYAE